MENSARRNPVDAGAAAPDRRRSSRRTEDRRGPSRSRSLFGRLGGATLTAIGLAAGLAACAASPSRDAGGDDAGREPPTIIGSARGVGVEEAARGIGSPTPVDPNGPVTIALLAPTGAADPGVRAAGEALVDAAQLAQRDVGDQRLRLEVFDTRGEPAGAAAAARAALGAGASLIIGPLFAESTSAAAPVAAERGVSLLSFSTNPSVAGGNVYLLSFLTAQEIERVIQYASSRGVRQIATLAPEGAFGEIAVAAADGAARSSGGVVAEVQRYQRDFEGIEAAVTQFVERSQLRFGEEGPPGALLADEGQALQTVAAYLAFFDISPRTTKFLGAGGWNSELTQKETALRGGWFAAPDPAIQAEFAERFETAIGRPPHPLAALAYDGVAASAAMLQDARATRNAFPFSAQAIAAPSGFLGVNGLYRFLPNGLNQRGLAVLEVRADRFAVIDPAPTSFSGL